ncbi:MAG: hypothetical protein ACK59Y_01585, partial [Betaproteobacteria bacterium]
PWRRASLSVFAVRVRSAVLVLGIAGSGNRGDNGQDAMLYFECSCVYIRVHWKSAARQGITSRVIYSNKTNI